MSDNPPKRRKEEQAEAPRSHFDVLPPELRDMIYGKLSELHDRASMDLAFNLYASQAENEHIDMRGAAWGDYAKGNLERKLAAQAPTEYLTRGTEFPISDQQTVAAVLHKDSGATFLERRLQGPGGEWATVHEPYGGDKDSFYSKPYAKYQKGAWRLGQDMEMSGTLATPSGLEALKRASRRK